MEDDPSLQELMLKDYCLGDINWEGIKFSLIRISFISSIVNNSTLSEEYPSVREVFL